MRRTRSDGLHAPRAWWPLLILLSAIALTAIAAFDAQRAVRSQDAVAERALHDYAAFAAWSFAQRLEVALRAMEGEALGAVNHGDLLHTYPEVPHASDLPRYLPWNNACQCRRTRLGPTPESYFAFRIGDASLEVAGPSVVRDSSPTSHAGYPAHDVTHGHETWKPIVGGHADAYAPSVQRWILDSLTHRIRAAPAPDHGFSLVIGDSVDASGPIVTYTLMPTAWGDTMVYGARYSRAGFDSVLVDVLDGGALDAFLGTPNGLLPKSVTQGRANRDVLALRVRDAHDRTLYASSPADTALDARLDLPARSGQLVVETRLRPELASTLLVGGLPQSHLPFLIALLALAATLAGVAVLQLRRESEIGRLRADFVSSVSHELRTPVAQIRLYVETLRLGRTRTDADRRWALAHIERETTRLAHLVENVLRFTTWRQADAATDASAHSASIELAPALAEIVEEFAPLALARGAHVELHEDDPATVAIPPDALRHIVLNLLDNAIKYGPDGQRVRVSTSLIGDEVHVAVADEGPGVPESERERIWRPFVRGAGGAHRGGSGIGLAIVRDVAESHGGRVWVESSSAGARFVVALPCASRIDPVARQGRTGRADVA